MNLTKTYAEALIELGNIDELYDDYKIFLNCLDENKDFSKLLNTATLSKAEKKKIIDDSIKLNKNFVDFIKVLIDNQRFSIINSIFNEYENLYYQKKDILHFILKSSNVINNVEKSNIEKGLKNKFKKDIVIEYIIDKDLIGGYVLYHQDKILDKSILNQLTSIKNTIM